MAKVKIGGKSVWTENIRNLLAPTKEIGKVKNYLYICPTGTRLEKSGEAVMNGRTYNKYMNSGACSSSSCQTTATGTMRIPSSVLVFPGAAGITPPTPLL